MDIAGWISDFFGQVGDLLNDIFAAILTVLPDSPFQGMLSLPENILEILGYVNWFIPVREIRIATYTWIGAVTVYYIWMVVLRYIKAVE